jgi:hypothetical protein
MTKRKISEKLLDRLRKDFPELEISDNHIIKRVNTGRRGRNSEGWKWFVSGGYNNIGSEETMTFVLQAKELGLYYNKVTYDREIFVKQ